MLPIEKKHLYELVVEEIIEKINKGEWTANFKLPGEYKLSSDFRVSRNSVREALKTLSYMGILETKNGAGTFVSENALMISLAENITSTLNNETFLYELTDIRMIVECQNAYWATTRATDREIRKLGSILKKGRAKDLGEMNSKRQAHDEFHYYLAVISHNRLSAVLFLSIQNAIRTLLRERYVKLPLEERIEMLDDHEEIFQSIKKREPREARKKMRDHLEKCLMKAVSSHPNSV